METNYSETAKNLIDLMGGMNNIGSVSHCMTRLHFTVKNNRKVQQDALKKADGVMKVVASINQYQIVVGIDVADIYDEIVKVRESMPERDPVSGVRSFFMEQYPVIYTKADDLPPAKINSGSHVKNSLIASGAIINGTVEDSLIFKKSYIGNNCYIKNSIILNDVYIADNSHLENCIVESHSTIHSDYYHKCEQGVDVVIEAGDRFII